MLAAAAFAVYAVLKAARVPAGAIGQADAQTNIQIAGASGFDALQIIFIAGVMAAVFAAIQLARTARGNRREQ